MKSPECIVCAANGNKWHSANFKWLHVTGLVDIKGVSSRYPLPAIDTFHFQRVDLSAGKSMTRQSPCFLDRLTNYILYSRRNQFVDIRSLRGYLCDVF